MPEVPGPPESHNPAEDEQWSDLARQFFDVTDEVLHLRHEAIKAILISAGIDYERALTTLDSELSGDQQPTAEARAYANTEERLMTQESAIASEMTRVDPLGHSINIIETGVIGEGYQAVGEEEVHETTFAVRGNRIIQIVDNDQDEENVDVAELSLTEAQKILRWVKVIRRYVGQSMYGREPQPDDPA